MNRHISVLIKLYLKSRQYTAFGLGSSPLMTSDLEGGGPVLSPKLRYPAEQGG